MPLTTFIFVFKVGYSFGTSFGNKFIPFWTFSEPYLYLRVLQKVINIIIEFWEKIMDSNVLNMYTLRLVMLRIFSILFWRFVILIIGVPSFWAFCKSSLKLALFFFSFYYKLRRNNLETSFWVIHPVLKVKFRHIYNLISSYIRNLPNKEDKSPLT